MNDTRAAADHEPDIREAIDLFAHRPDLWTAMVSVRNCVTGDDADIRGSRPP